MDQFEGTNFSVIDVEGRKTIAFAVNKSDEDAYSLQKLDCSIEYQAGKVKKTFFYNEEIPAGDSKDLVLLEIDNGKATLNWGMLKDNKFLISDQPSTVGYKMLYSEKPEEYTDIKYTPDFKRPISIVDPEIGDEVKPVLYYDDEANMVKAKIKMAPNKPYIALEVR